MPITGTRATGTSKTGPRQGKPVEHSVHRRRTGYEPATKRKAEEEWRQQHNTDANHTHEWCVNCGRQQKKGKGVKLWRDKCEPIPSYSTMLAHGHEPVMENHEWMCVSCGMTGPKLLYRTCGHTREGNKRKTHTAMQFGTGNHPKRITTQHEEQWEGDPNWKPFNAEDYGYSRIHFRKHVL